MQVKYHGIMHEHQVGITRDFPVLPFCQHGVNALVAFLCAVYLHNLYCIWPWEVSMPAGC